MRCKVQARHGATLRLPVYATLIDLGCLAALWLLMHREGGRLIDLIGFERDRLGRDVLLGLALIPPSLLFILGGNGVSSLLVYGTLAPPTVFQPLAPLATLYAILAFPLLWGFTEQMTYNGYLAPRLQVLTRSTAIAVALVAFPWSFQHAVLPVTFDSSWVLYRTLSPIPFSVFAILIYFRMRRIVPLAIAHWLMDGAAVLMSALWPPLR